MSHSVIREEVRLTHEERAEVRDAYKRTAAEGYAVLYLCIERIIAARPGEA